MCYNGLSLVKVQDKKYDRVQDRELVMNCNNLITSLGAGWKDKICFCIENVSIGRLITLFLPQNSTVSICTIRFIDF